MRAAGFAGSRRNHLFRLWREVLACEPLPQLDRWLADNFRKNARYGSRDRRWYSELLFAAVRHGYLALFCDFYEKSSHTVLEAAFDDFLKAFPNTAAVVKAWRDLDDAVFFARVWIVYELFGGRSDEPPCSESVLARCKEKNVLSDMRRLQNEGSLVSGMLLSSVPLWIASDLAERQKASQWSAQLLASFLESQSSRPPLWMRLNHPDKREQALTLLKQEGFRVECVDDALSVVGERGIFVSEAYKQGLLEIQDYASQRAGAAVQAKPGDVVWDACAGGGGKTLQIASRLQNRGAVYASDVREFKLEEVKKRARRAGFFNVRCQAWDGVALPDFPREVQKRGGFDWVLVDAPCSSSGTWRRNPDAKYRIDEGMVREITLLQKGILRNAAQAVGASGHLVYSTCSWLVPENEGVVNGFLAENPTFELVSMGLLGTPAANSDTLFAAVLCKKNRA